MIRLRPNTETVGLLVITVAGALAFVYPLAAGRAHDHTQADALLLAFICAASVILLGLALQTHHLSARLLAVLAALVAVDAVLRIPAVIGVAGFSPVFFLMLVGGFEMGPSFGFAMGALTLLVSAALTAGFGPWLPYQMLAAGWVGMGAGLLGGLTVGRHSGIRLSALAVYAVVTGFGYGVLLDLWEWPLLLGGGTSPISWAPGLATSELARRFGAFYLTTSLVYDAFRAGGNLLLVLVAGAPVLAALHRFRLRFLVDWAPAGNMSPNVGASPRYRAPTGAD